MVEDADILRAAKLLIHQHGPNAPMLAVRWADEMLAAGDVEGRAVWLLILAAVEELIRREPKQGKRVN